MESEKEYLNVGESIEDFYLEYYDLMLYLENENGKKYWTNCCYNLRVVVPYSLLEDYYNNEIPDFDTILEDEDLYFYVLEKYRDYAKQDAYRTGNYEIGELKDEYLWKKEVRPVN